MVTTAPNLVMAYCHYRSQIQNDDEPKRCAFECTTGNSDRLRLCRFAGYRVNGRTVRKQVHHVESRMEYYWELRSKNAQNIKALMCPLYRSMHPPNGRTSPPLLCLLNSVNRSYGGCRSFHAATVFLRCENPYLPLCF